MEVTVELAWLKQSAGTMKISSNQRNFKLSRVYFYINLNYRNPSPIYVTSAVRVFVLLYSFSIFRYRRSKRKMKIAA